MSDDAIRELIHKREKLRQVNVSASDAMRSNMRKLGIQVRRALLRPPKW